jgi:hypothetical protein
VSKTAKPKQRYARLLGEFWRNPKVRRLSLEARGLLVTAWSYAADQMTDGVVPLELLQAWAGKRYASIMAELTRGSEEPGDRPMLSVAEGDIDAHSIGWEDVNITRDGWEETKRAALARKEKSRATTRAVTPTSHVTDAVTGGDVTDIPLDEGRRTKEGEGEPPTPEVIESPESDYGRQVSAVRRAWAKAFEKHRGTPATNLDPAAVATVVASVAAKGGDFGAVLAEAVAAYWATDWPRRRENRPSLRNFAGSLETLLASVSDAPNVDPPDWTPDHGAPKSRANFARWNRYCQGAES